MEKEKIKINKIDIKGLRRIHYSVVDNEFKNIGNNNITDFNSIQSELVKALNNLRNYELFEDIKVKIIEVNRFDTGILSNNNGNDNTLIDVVVDVKESRLGSFKFGTFLEDGEATFEASGLLRSPFGSGEKIESSVSIGNERSNSINLSYSKPKIWNSMWNFSSGFREYSKNHQWASSHDELVRGYHAHIISPNGNYQFSYNADWRNIIPTKGKNNYEYIASKEVINMAVPSFKSSIGFLYRLDHRNNPVIPSQGSFMEISSEFAGIGGSVSFAKSDFTFQHFIEVTGRESDKATEDTNKNISGLVLGATLKAGVLCPYDKIPYISDIMFGPQSKGVPKNGCSTSLINDRFFLGGPLSLRGFNYRGAGPSMPIGKNAKMDSIGGDIRWSAGINASFPVPFSELAAAGVRMHVFGNVGSLCLWKNASINELFRDGARLSVGAGVVIPTPMGRMEVNYTFPLQFNKNGDDVRRIQIGVGLDFL